MSLSHAILGILHLHPMSGYDLKTQYFDGSIAHFWHADQAQIYRTLDKLEALHLVHSELVIQENRPNRKVYHLTDAGRDEFRQWQLSVQPLPSVREPFLIQLFMANELPNSEILRLIAEQIAQHQKRLAAYQAIPLPALEDPQIDRWTALQRLTLEMGLASEAMYLQWLEMAKAVVEQLEDAQP